MKKSLMGIAAIVAMIGAPAFAADMPVKAPPAGAAFSWSGCYIGGTAGGAWERSNYTGTPTGSWIGTVDFSNVSTVTTGKLNSQSAIGGGEIGCNWQSGPIVFGLEGDLSSWGLSSSSAATLPDPGNPGFVMNGSTSVSSHWLGTVRPRLGFANNNWLFYVTGGAAFTRATFAQSVFFTATGSTQAGSVTNSLTGWTVGGGVEVGLTSNWLIKAEYLYVGFPTQTVNEFNPTFPTFTETATNRLSASIFRAGLDYKFGGLLGGH
jgi:outer membrane immunogenic protein